MPDPPRAFEHERTLIPDHVNWSMGVLHTNGLFYFTSTMQPTRRRPDVTPRSFLNVFDPELGRVVQQTILDGAAAGAPLILPDGDLLTISPEHVRRWSAELEPLELVPWTEAVEALDGDPDRVLNRERILVPLARDGAASMNYDPYTHVVHSISLCGRWMTYDPSSRRIIRNRSMGLFLSNTLAVSTNGIIYYVGVSHADAIAAFDQPLAQPARWLLPRGLSRLSRREFLESETDANLFLKALLLGKLLDADQGVVGALIPEPTGKGYRVVELPIDGASETSPTIGHDGTVYLCDGAGWVRAFTPGLERLKWKHAVGPHAYGSLSICADGAIYVVAGHSLNETFVIRLEDRDTHAEEAWRLGGGRRRWSGGSERASLKAARSVVVVTTGGVGYLTGVSTRRGARAFAIDLTTGQILAEADYDSPGGFVACMPVGANRLVAFTADLLDMRYRRWPFRSEAGLRVYRVVEN